MERAPWSGVRIFRTRRKRGGSQTADHQKATARKAPGGPRAGPDVGGGGSAGYPEAALSPTPEGAHAPSPVAAHRFGPPARPAPAVRPPTEPAVRPPAGPAVRPGPRRRRSEDRLPAAQRVRRGRHGPHHAQSGLRVRGRRAHGGGRLAQPAPGRDAVRLGSPGAARTAGGSAGRCRGPRAARVRPPGPGLPAGRPPARAVHGAARRPAARVSGGQRRRRGHRHPPGTERLSGPLRTAPRTASGAGAPAPGGAQRLAARRARPALPDVGRGGDDDGGGRRGVPEADVAAGGSGPGGAQHRPGSRPVAAPPRPGDGGRRRRPCR